MTELLSGTNPKEGYQKFTKISIFNGNNFQEISKIILSKLIMLYLLFNFYTKYIKTGLPYSKCLCYFDFSDFLYKSDLYGQYIDHDIIDIE